jgi:hypothetical protein
MKEADGDMLFLMEKHIASSFCAGWGNAGDLAFF